MSQRLPPDNSLVLYKTHPAVVKRVGEKLEIELAGGETQRVRPKDVVLLHPGPLRALADLRPQPGDAQTAWEMLAGAWTTLPELAELIYRAYTPATAWAAWQLVADGLYFRGSPAEIVACTAEEVAQAQADRAADAAEKTAWRACLGRIRARTCAPEDERYVREIEALALGRSERSRILHELGREETAENAHATLLEIGVWTPAVNPHPWRQGVAMTQADLPLPDLPDEPRRDLSHLPAFAIDDIHTEVPDDALSFDGERLWVHVADPAALIVADSPLDLEARGRGASLHLPEGVIHMLPLAATPLLGLGLADLSPALSFGITLDTDMRIAAVEIVPSWVRVQRLTYEEAAARLEAGPLAALYRLALGYQARREADGAFNIDLPEVDVRVECSTGGVGRGARRSLEGCQVFLRPVPPLPSRLLVENAMVLAGEAVARYAVEHAIPVAFATQDPPDTAEQPDNAGLAALIAFRRTLKRSQYHTSPGPHSGLGLPAYCQVTSPMRRYLDLVAHQQLRGHLLDRPLLSQEQILERVGAVEALLGPLRQAERQSDEHWKLVYLLQHPDWRGEGVVVERRERNHTVLIPELGLEPQVRLSGDPPLDSTVRLAVSHVDLPRLDARFRAQ